MTDSTQAPPIRLPQGRHFAVTWGIPDDFGGMTSAFLHRSRAFVRLGGVAVEIVTFDTRPDYPAFSDELRRRGELLDDMSIVNIWDWLREWDLPADAPGTLNLDKHPLVPLEPDAAYRSTFREGHELTRTRYASDGSSVLQVDHYRLDGTLLLSDRRDLREPGTVSGRSLVLCDRDGRPVRSWGATWSLYRYWLDRLRGGAWSYLIVDSKTIANFMLTYRRKKAVTLHVVHSSHLAGDVRPIGPLRATRRTVFENLGDFDAVVVLTKRQRKDVIELLGPQANLVVVPNSRDLALSADAPLERPVGRGVVLASLTTRKRVDHAITAAADAIASGAPITLDVFGEGETRPQLEALITERGVAGSVTLHGHRTDARAGLADASFLVLSASSEGSPLVLVEAMAAGCIPISYDIPYGPADLISHGRNGLLVPAGDIGALAEAIRTLQAMPDHAVDRMRRRARRTAQRYSDLSVTRRWAREMARAAKRKAGPDAVPAGVKAVLRAGRTAIRRAVTPGR